MRYGIAWCSDVSSFCCRPTSWAAFHTRRVVSTEVSIRQKFKTLLPKLEPYFRTDLPKYDPHDPVGSVHRLTALSWQDGFSTLGPHIWAACLTLHDDNGVFSNLDAERLREITSMPALHL